MRVLLVEDDPTTSKSIELMLTHANLNVYATDLGEVAERAVVKRRLEQGERLVEALHLHLDLAER